MKTSWQTYTNYRKSTIFPPLPNKGKNLHFVTAKLAFAKLSSGGPKAEGVGFEPTVPLPVQQFSRLSYSTTLAPFLIKLHCPFLRGIFLSHDSCCPHSVLVLSELEELEAFDCPETSSPVTNSFSRALQILRTCLDAF